jgi:hypothetical protein
MIFGFADAVRCAKPSVLKQIKNREEKQLLFQDRALKGF